MNTESKPTVRDEIRALMEETQGKPLRLVSKPELEAVRIGRKIFLRKLESGDTIEKPSGEG